MSIKTERKRNVSEREGGERERETERHRDI